MHYQVESFLNALLLPKPASLLIKPGKVFNEGFRVSVWLIESRLIVVLTKTGIVLPKMGIIEKRRIVDARVPCAFVLFWCSHLQH